MENLSTNRLIQKWDKYPYFTKEFKQAITNIFRTTIHLLIDLGTDLNEENALPILEYWILQINLLQTETGFKIDTETREDLLFFHHDIVEAFHLQIGYGFADEWRKW